MVYIYGINLGYFQFTIYSTFIASFAANSYYFIIIIYVYIIASI